MIYYARVKATGEVLTVYKMKDGNYYDYENMGSDFPPKAIRAGKKQFEPYELIIGKEYTGK